MTEPTFPDAATNDNETWPGSDENLRALGRLLAGWKCCGSPALCDAACQGSEISDVLARAARVVGEELERLEKTDD